MKHLSSRLAVYLVIHGVVLFSLSFRSVVGASSDSDDKPPLSPLFLELPADATTDAVALPSFAKRQRRVFFDAALIPAPARARQQQLHLNLFDDADFVGQVNAVMAGLDDTFTLVGGLRDRPSSEFVLTCRDHIMVGIIHAGDGRVFEVRVVNEMFHQIREVEPESYPACGTREPHHVEFDQTTEQSQAASTTAADDGSVIDVMVLYTPAARSAAGGVSAILSMINNAIAQGNLAYQNSLITPRLRLVHAAEIAYTESDSFDLDLDRLTFTGDGYMDNVHTLRNTYGADMVTLLSNDYTYCGLAWLMTSLSSSFQSYAFSVVNWSCLTLQTLAHELGHNQGCHHDRENASGSVLYPYAYGWRFYDNTSTQRRTIMAYAPGSRISYFSNPNVLYNGVATGVAIGQPNQAYNAQTINNTANTVANFRQSVTSLQPPTGVSATDGTYNDRVVITWNSATGATSYEVWRHTTNNSGAASRIATVTGTTHTDSIVVRQTVYYYWIKSKNSTTTSAFSTSDSGFARDNRPNPPSNLTATAQSNSVIALAWTDNANNETGFRIERASASGGPWTQIATVGSNITTYSNAGLTSCTTYYYRVQAYNGDGDSPYSNIANEITNGCIPPPSAPSNLTATTQSSSAITLSWTDNANNEFGFKLERVVFPSSAWTIITNLAANTTSYTDTGLSFNTTYQYRVRAYTNGGDSDHSNVATATTLNIPPGAPVSLTATSLTYDQVILNWTDTASNELGFEIEIAPAPDGPWTQTGTVSSNVTTYLSTGLDPLTTYHFRVRAQNEVGVSDYSNIASATTKQRPPAAPTELTAVNIVSNQIALAWTDNADNETQFFIERATAATGPWVPVGQVAANVTTFLNMNLLTCVTYYYRVRAYNSAGYSDYTNTANATTGGCPLTGPSSPQARVLSPNSIVICWTDNDQEETGFRIQRATSATGPWTTIGNTAPDVTCFTSAQLLPQTKYFYRVAALGINGRSPWSSVINATTQKAGTPAAPSDLQGIVSGSPQIDLTWQDNANNETSFRIQRRSSPSDPWQVVANLPANTTAWSDTTVTSATAYEYQVRARNSAGNSAPSNRVSFTTP